MADEKKLSDEQLDAVAGGMKDVNMSGSKAGGNQTVYDEHTQNVNVAGDFLAGGGNVKAGGDVTGGGKTDIKTDIQTSVKVDA